MAPKNNRRNGNTEHGRERPWHPARGIKRDEKMKRADILWLAIRIMGLFLIAKALTAFPAIVSNSLSLYSVTSFFEQTLPSGQALINSMEKQCIAHLINSVAEFLFFGLIGLYFCRKGRWLYRLIELPKDEVEIR